MTVHPLYTEWYTVNGESMATYGWGIESITTGLPERKGENVSSPIQHGSMFREKRFGPRTDTWNIWVCDADPETGISPDTEDGKRAQFNSNMDHVNRILNGLTPNGLNNGALKVEKHYLKTNLYNIGDIGPAGGKIFITPNTPGNATGKYFEAADNGWTPFGDNLANWSKSDWATTLMPGADGIEIGTGYQNTLDIIAQNGAPIFYFDNYAAYACSQCNFGGFNDWFLPSKNELLEMFLHSEQLGDLSLLYDYWSSTDSSEFSDSAFSYTTSSGFSLRPKYEETYGPQALVRPVRMFSLSGQTVDTLTSYAEVASTYSYEDAKQFNYITLSTEVTYPDPFWYTESSVLSLTGTNTPTNNTLAITNIGNAPVTLMQIVFTAGGSGVTNPYISNTTLSNYPCSIGYTGSLTSGQSVTIDTSAYTVYKGATNSIANLYREGYRQEWFEFYPTDDNTIVTGCASGSFDVSITYKKAYF